MKITRIPSPVWRVKGAVVGAGLCLTVVCVCGKTANSPTIGEGFVDPLGYYDATPTFSWRLPTSVEKQTAYRIETKAGDKSWDSGWVESDQCSFVR